MAEQDVRSQQLSIRDIARLWSAETGEDAGELEDELSNWAYAEAVDRGAMESGDTDSDDAPGTLTALKIEPDPARKLSWYDLEAFCKDHDRLIPHFWPEPVDETPDSSAPVPPSEPSRLVVRAMTKLGPISENSAAERRLQGPVSARKAKRSKRKEPEAAPTDAEAREDQPAEAAAPESPDKEPAKQAPEVVTVWPAPESMTGTAAHARFAPAPVSAYGASRRDSRLRPAMLVGGVALGAAFGAALAVAAVTLWLEYRGAELIALSGEDSENNAALAAAEARLADAEALARASDQRAARMEGQLTEARREAYTLRVETRDVAALTQGLEEARTRNAELSATLDAMRADGNDSQKAFLDQLSTAQRDATRSRIRRPRTTDHRPKRRLRGGRRAAGRRLGASYRSPCRKSRARRCRRTRRRRTRRVR